MSLQVPQQSIQHAAHLPDLASAYREFYRAKLRADVQATPLIFPLHLTAYWIIPTLYLAIPHKNRPWLYRARWLVLALVCAFHVYMIKHVKSPNFAASYGVGIIASWGTIWNFYLLVWTRPQWDARRVERLKVSQPIDRLRNDRVADRLPASLEKGASAVRKLNSQEVAISEIDRNAFSSRPAGSAANTPISVHGNGITPTTGMRHRESQPVQENGDQAGDEEALVKRIIRLNNSDKNPPLDQDAALELYRRAREEEYEYYWQEYPANASFLTRLDWVFDIVSTFRLTGWESAPSCLPPYKPPPTIGPYQLPLEYGSHRSKQGYERTVSRRKLVLSRLFVDFLPSYIIVDVCAALMTSDPYFVAGPEHDHPLPPHLASLHPALLFLQRTTLGFVAVIFALQCFGAMLLALYCPPILGFRAHPWHLPSFTGSFSQVTDRGLSGFWGAWWHQTFRVGFSAPTKWLLRLGYLPSPRRHGGVSTLITPAVSAIMAFVQSGMIHAAGSYTSVPTTYYWGPPIFFALSGLGMVLQTMLSRGLQRRIERLPLWLRRLGNVAFTFLWLLATGWTLLDDFGRCGIWLWEPVPVSFSRAAGLGVDRRVWRYDKDSLPRWHWGSWNRWWETGIAV
ncbi:hypothetical protein F5B22DRAFT_659355 [Xylaria bambusicola]|uniref:uncharacterized protein n=1 Tax=Xylaria bambusicola TaxID=326684 RepID=UPI0020073435|nr:uncharacterized protein F5B22DRAFT_659355 [Xylaria bambusicola]KAI0508418.1 hypothetical protein F5B22DRAFT_659355 [Xylaria bambusicola]